MFRTIVVGTNWSDTADVAFAKAVELARLGGGRLHVVSATGAGPAPVSVSGGEMSVAIGERMLTLPMTEHRLGT